MKLVKALSLVCIVVAVAVIYSKFGSQGLKTERVEDHQPDDNHELFVAKMPDQSLAINKIGSAENISKPGSMSESQIVKFGELTQLSLIPPFDETGLLSLEAVEAYGLSSTQVAQFNKLISETDLSLYKVERKNRAYTVSPDRKRVTFIIREDMPAAQHAHDSFFKGIGEILDPDQKLVFIEINQSAIDLRFGGFGRYRQEVELVAVDAGSYDLNGSLVVEGDSIPLERIRVKRSSAALAGIAEPGVPFLWLRHYRELVDGSI